MGAQAGAAPPVPDSAEPDVARILSGMGQFADLTEQLVRDDRLAAALPLLEVAPASAQALDLATLFENGVYNQIAPGATDLDSLDKDISNVDIGGGRRVTLRSEAE